MAEPSEEVIMEFVSITQASRAAAVKFLKAHSLDPNRAINAFFEGSSVPEPEPQVGWPASSQQGAYGYQDPSAIAYGPENRTYGAAPSRPPSRIGSRDQHGDVKMAQPYEMPGDQPAASTGTSQTMTLEQREEHDMQQAMAMSLGNDVGGVGQSAQETGVVSSDTSYFGPARADHYDEPEWALTLLGPQDADAKINPDPEQRKRGTGEPAFLRPTSDATYLSGVMTILHSIPMAREALLLRGKLLEDYGHDAQWWNGQPINLPKLVSVGDSHWADNWEWDDILVESQRLMAFLNSTNRAFGSLDSLENLGSVRVPPTWKEKPGPEATLSRFLENWEPSAVSATSDDRLATVFSSLALKKPLFSGPLQDTQFYLLSLERPEVCETLYDVIDEAIWQDTPGMELDDVWLDRVAEVFTVHLRPQDGDVTRQTLDIDIPAVFYPDRYLGTCKEFARKLRTRRLEVLQECDRLEKLIVRFSKSITSANPNTSLHIVLQKAINGSVFIASQQQAPMDNSVEALGQQEQLASVQDEAEELAKQLKIIMDKIDEKLESLKERQKQARESLRSHSRELTTPAAAPNDPPHHKYLLRGVCTRPHITYVLRPNSGNDGIHEGRNENEGVRNWQWWRMSFSVDDAKDRSEEADGKAADSSDQEELQRGRGRRPRSSSRGDVIGYTTRRVSEADVLRAVREEYRTALLVYASEDAVNFKEGSLPEPLQEFINADNRAFEAEIQDYAMSQYDHQESNSSSEPSGNSTGGASQKQATVNVFDYQVSSFPEQQTGQEQEMQERGGAGLLAQTRQQSASSTNLMDIQEEDGDTIMERMNPAA